MRLTCFSLSRHSTLHFHALPVNDVLGARYLHGNRLLRERHKPVYICVCVYVSVCVRKSVRVCVCVCVCVRV